MRIIDPCSNSFSACVRASLAFLLPRCTGICPKCLRSLPSIGIRKSSALDKNFGYSPWFPRIVYKKIGSSSVTWFATKIIFPLLGIFSKPEISRFSVFVVIFLATLSKIFRIIFRMVVLLLLRAGYPSCNGGCRLLLPSLRYPGGSVRLPEAGILHSVSNYPAEVLLCPQRAAEGC